MKMFVKILLLTIICIVNAVAQMSDAGITTSLALGDVMTIDAEKKLIRLKTKDGSIDVVLNADTEFMRVSPDNPIDLKAAVASTLSAIGAGDRIIAQGTVSPDKKTISARRVILMTKADIGKRQAIEREKWLTHGIAGRVVALDSVANEITVAVRDGFGIARSAKIETNRDTIFRRYSSNSVRFGDAQTSKFNELKIGDQLRAHGEKSGDGGKLAAEEIIFGSFRTVAGKITAIDAAKGEVRIKDLQTNQDVTIDTNGDTLLRRFPVEIAARLTQTQTTRGNQPILPQPQVATSSPQTSSPSVKRDAAGDINALLEQMPVLNLSELKVGDAIAASCISAGDAASRLMAVKFIAGIEPFLPRQTANLQQQQRAAPSFNIPGLEGVSVP